MASGNAAEAYTRSQIRRILGINENSLRSWERAGLTPAKESYTFSDLVSLSILENLRENRISARQISEALDWMRVRLSNVRHPLDELKIVSEGRRVAVQLPGERVEAVTGQLLLDFDSGGTARVETIEGDGRSGRNGELPGESTDSPEAPVGPDVEGIHAGRILELEVREDPAQVEDEALERAFDRAMQLEKAGAPEREVIEAYQNVLLHDPGAVGALVNLGTIHYRKGRLEKAEQCFEQALDAYPDYALAHFNLASVYHERRELDRAADQLRATLRADPKFADAYFNLAVVEQDRKRPVAALRKWQAYLKLDSQGPWANVARASCRALLEVPNSD